MMTSCVVLADPGTFHAVFLSSRWKWRVQMESANAPLELHSQVSSTDQPKGIKKKKNSLPAVQVVPGTLDHNSHIAVRRPSQSRRNLLLVRSIYDVGRKPTKPAALDLSVARSSGRHARVVRKDPCADGLGQRRVEDAGAPVGLNSLAGERRVVVAAVPAGRRDRRSRDERSVD